MEKIEHGLPDDRVALLKEPSALATQYDMVRFLKKVSEVYGMQAFLVIRLPSGAMTSLQSVSVISSWPAELVSRYDQMTTIGKGPVLDRVLASAVPFTIDLEQLAKGKTGRESDILTLFQSFRMPRSALFPVADIDGNRGAVSFSGVRALPSEQEMLELTMIAIRVFDRLYQIGRHDHKPADHLTEREVDCLTWTAAGKTSAEISEILGLSEHTVNHYLNRATRKLDTVNRTQAVAKAIRTGIIT